MRPFIIDEEVRLKLSDLSRHAEENIFSMDDLLDIKNGAAPPAGDREGFSVSLPFGYKVVFSLDGLPTGASRHLSVSIPEPNKLPSVEVVSEIMALLGFKDFLQDAHISIEELPGERKAINVQEVIFRVVEND